MADYEEMTPKEAYVQGRLLGLNELIKLLKDAVENGENAGSSALVKTVVIHISNEMDSIIGDLRDQHGDHPVLRQAAQKSEEIKKQAEEMDDETGPQEVKKHVQAADDLMKNLVSLKSK